MMMEGGREDGQHPQHQQQHPQQPHDHGVGGGVGVGLAEYDDEPGQQHMEGETFYVVRAEDMDESGRHLVGVESGPWDSIDVATSNIDVVPEYGPTGMADELILLAQDMAAWHATVSVIDGCPRFVILGSDRERSINMFGRWELDADEVKRALK
eukprot:CAMPEP_0197599078 /NCGR_PEP_ID=MMETSP1326-20131121/30632_1 /TAXON_ID=1155430 /ORGANISM="Genus nov. species nov., Strain RCC2288" /LENGTH=153 /DNA_ID=CAMNT_0043165981 /DNA_START=206 /DNA_END=664 /DNA_ORIENTATION=-